MQASRPAPKSLLVVDDSHCYCTLVERAFRQVEPGTAVFVMSDGQRAVEHLALCGTSRPLPELVLLDRTMPGGPDGYEVLRAARALEHLAALPILMVSGSDDPDHVEEAHEAGASGYIIKPPVQSDYPQLVRQVLAWWQEETWRRYGGAASGLTLAARESALQSVATSPIAMQNTPSADFLPLPDDGSVLVRLYEHFRDVVRQTFDPVELAINEACKRHHIPPAHARGRGHDQVTVANRQRVIFDLFDAGYSDRVVFDNFMLSERQIERMRAAWRAKSGGLLADRKN